MTTIPKLYGLILAGGYSRRMGQDKALLSYHGKPQIEYVHDLLSASCEKVFLSKRPEQPTYKQMAAIDDAPEYKDIGPLGGILSAMKAYPDAAWLIMACDLPYVTPKTLEYLISKRDPSKVSTVFKSQYDGFPEPLCAIWEPSAKARALEFLRQGKQCPRKVLINSDTNLLVQQEAKWLDNVNTAEEYQQAVKGVKE